MRLLSIFFLIVGIGGGTSPLFAQRPDLDYWNEGYLSTFPYILFYENYPYTKEIVVTARKKWGQLESEIAQSRKENEWIGSYHIEGAELHDTNLLLAPKGGVLLIGTYSCQQAITAINYGEVTFSPSRISLNPKLNSIYSNHSHHGTGVLPTSLIPVKWGGAHYLISEDELELFCTDYVAGRGIYQDDDKKLFPRVFIKVAEENNKKWSRPTLPIKYSHLVKSPINARVSSVGRSRLKRTAPDSYSDEVETPIVINAGSKDGVKRYMSFRFIDSDYPEYFKITRVNKSSSTGLLIGQIEKGKHRLSKDDLPVVNVGQKVTTKPIYY